MYENVEFVQKRVQEFIPASGRNKTNKATKALSDFLSECFDSNGKMKDKEHPKFVGKQCDWCIFSEKGICRKWIFFSLNIFIDVYSYINY